MKIGHSLANEIYLGKLTSEPLCGKEETRDELLTISIQQPESPVRKGTPRSQSLLLDNSSTKYRTLEGRDMKEKCISNGAIPKVNMQKTGTDLTKGQVKKSPSILKSNSLDHAEIQPNEMLHSKTKQMDKSVSSNFETTRAKKSTLRQKFYDNYSSMLTMTFKAKKKVSFVLPSIERDTSDVSISSHLSAISDCIASDDEDNEDSLFSYSLQTQL
ncbi:hypothetical protein EB796_024109 [Bugula neritina]|uniref:Uncharacterized protein n=1 Tax=Bugula neritina TaxID=10212 RepID=A0A7J7IVH3_BUGNE|nr:hypothetical protein EB796_024109 [Bugula neritina]